MNKQTIRIVAAVVDTRQLTLYKEDGLTIIIPQGDPRLRPIVEAVTPQLVHQGWAEVVVPDAETDDTYASFEKQSGGVVKLFRVAKDKLKSLFSEEARKAAADAEAAAKKPVVPMAIGNVPQPGDMPDLERDTLIGRPEHEDDEPEEEEQEEEFVPLSELSTQPPKVVHTMNVVDEIIKHAVPVSSAEFTEIGVAKQGNVVEANGTTDSQKNEVDDATHTIIAVVDNKVIPGMEKIKTQFGRAAKLGNPAGVEKFLQRLASVIERRSHSVEDLLKFMERGDLPIADDGSILIYKVLQRRSGNKFVDCHTKSVEQWVGAYVCMDEKLVDHNRKNECSNGLHVARRGYINVFNGDVCVLAKLAPEDVIAVPAYDANKMRVCGYHIIAELTQDQHNEVRRNRPITSTEEGRKLLARAMSGQHVHKTHEVRITGHMGQGVVVKKLEAPQEPQPAQAPVAEAEDPVVCAVPLEAAVALENPEKETTDTPIDPKEVIKQVEQQMSRKEQAKILYDALAGGGQEALDKILAFKKASKVSWEKLGLPDISADGTISLRDKDMKALVSGKSYDKKAKKVKAKQAKAAKKLKKAVAAPAKKPSPLKDRRTPVATEAKEAVKAAFPAPAKKIQPPAPAGSRIVNGVELGEGSFRDRIHKLLSIGLTSVGVAQAVLKLKQQSKKSWTTLGITDKQVAEVTKLAQEK